MGYSGQIPKRRGRATNRNSGDIVYWILYYIAVILLFCLQSAVPKFKKSHLPQNYRNQNLATVTYIILFITISKTLSFGQFLYTVKYYNRIAETGLDNSSL